jgi:hypothetical protein
MDLPNEIIREICNRPELVRTWHGKTDLDALRLTCKLLCDIVSPRFARVSFSEITVSMARPSLRAFIELAQHPYFGPCVKHVTISPVFAPYDHIVPSAPSATPGKECSTEMIKLVATHLVRSRKEHELNTNGSFERMLSVAFKAFAQREQCLQLRFCDDEIDTLGEPDPLHDNAFRKYLVWRLDWKTTIEQTIRAVTSQDCKVDGITVDAVSRDNSVADSSLCINSIKHEMSSLCSQLSRLEISFTHDDIESTTKSVQLMVSAARNLKHLSLIGIDRFVNSPQSHVQMILQCVASTSLESISLYCFNLSETGLIGFLGRQRDTLQEITLLEGCLLTGSCMSLITWIKDNMLGLKELEIFKVCFEHHTMCNDSKRKTYTVGRDKDMKASLDDILDGKCEKDVKVGWQ